MTCAWAWGLASFFAFTGLVAAHPGIDRGRQLAFDAEFAAALVAFEEAEAGDDLTRDDLLQLLAARAYVHYAMENGEELERDVRRLATLDPSFAFDATIPPAVQQMHRSVAASLARPLRVDAEVAEEVSGTLTVRAFATGDEGHMVRSVRLFARVGDSDEWSLADRTISLPVAEDEELQYFAEAVGPGGAVVASLGTESDPRRASPGTPGEAPVIDEQPQTEASTGNGVPTWVWIGGGAAIAIVVVLAIVWLSGDGLTDNTQPTGPIIVEMGM